jgi:hypothetical protein
MCWLAQAQTATYLRCYPYLQLATEYELPRDSAVEYLTYDRWGICLLCGTCVAVALYFTWHSLLRWWRSRCVRSK